MKKERADSFPLFHIEDGCWISFRDLRPVFRIQLSSKDAPRRAVAYRANAREVPTKVNASMIDLVA